MFHQPVQSVATYRLVLSRHSGASTESRRPPLTSLPGPTAPFPPSPALVIGATRSSVPSHGMCGWFQLIQARRLLSGDGVGDAEKSEPGTSSRTAAGASAADPS